MLVENKKEYSTINYYTKAVDDQDTLIVNEPSQEKGLSQASNILTDSYGIPLPGSYGDIPLDSYGAPLTDVVTSNVDWTDTNSDPADQGVDAVGISRSYKKPQR